MSCDPIVIGSEVVGTICRPSTEWLYRNDLHCPVCGYQVGLVGMYQEWYGSRWTCLACGDQWQDGELLERPFMRGWRWLNVQHALTRVPEARQIGAIA